MKCKLLTLLSALSLLLCLTTILLWHRSYTYYEELSCMTQSGRPYHLIWALGSLKFQTSSGLPPGSFPALWQLSNTAWVAPHRPSPDGFGPWVFRFNRTSESCHIDQIDWTGVTLTTSLTFPHWLVAIPLTLPPLLHAFFLLRRLYRNRASRHTPLPPKSASPWRPLRYASIISLLLCIPTTFLWARSFWTADNVGWSTEHTNVGQLYLQNGRAWVYRSQLTPVDPSFSSRFDYQTTQPSTAAQRERVFLQQFQLFARTRGPYVHKRRLGIEYISQGNPALKYSVTPFTSYLSLPLWPLPLLLAILPTLHLSSTLHHHLRSRRRQSLGLCPTCGYDLRASTDRCPECGNPIPTPSVQSNS